MTQRIPNSISCSIFSGEMKLGTLKGKKLSLGPNREQIENVMRCSKSATKRTPSSIRYVSIQDSKVGGTFQFFFRGQGKFSAKKKQDHFTWRTIFIPRQYDFAIKRAQFVEHTVYWLLLLPYHLNQNSTALQFFHLFNFFFYDDCCGLRIVSSVNFLPFTHRLS